jgi:hypothetical protein
MPTLFFDKSFSPLHPLLLAGVGMRKRNILFIDVDVYLIGINFSEKVFRKAKEWSVNYRNSCSLTDYILLDDSTNEAKVSATLRFVRPVSTSQLIDAFNEAFKGCKQESIDVFKKSLKESINVNGVKKGDEIVFYWLQQNLVIAVNGEVKNMIYSSEIYKRLLEVYIDPKYTVSNELSTCLENHLNDFVLD